MENDFLAMDKMSSELKSHFLSFSQANQNFFSLGQKRFVRTKFILSLTKSILSEQMDEALVHIVNDIQVC